MQWLLLAVTVFLSTMAARSQELQGFDFSSTIVAVLAIMILIAMIFTILVSFSLRQGIAERYKLSGEIKTKEIEDKADD